MDDKKKKITLSAMKVFQNKGLEKATVSDIVKGAGIAQGTFYLYFPSKLSVMPAIAEVLVERTIKTCEKSMDWTMPFENQLEHFLEIVFQFTKEYRDIYALIYAGMGSSKQLDVWEAIYEPYYELIGNMLAKAKQRGDVRNQLIPKRSAALLIGLFESAAEQSFLYDNADEKAIQLKKDEALDFALYALGCFS